MVRILVVDDSQQWRIVVRLILEHIPSFHIVGEAVDGVEAIEKASTLFPDVVLLDVGMPRLNGIEAARQIRNLSPESKILFVSQESSADVVQGAFSLGAAGYVIKTQAAIELLAAVEAVRQGRRFVSSGVVGHVSAELAE